MINNHIIVNATALDSSGALTILEQFIEAIPPEKYEFIVFVNSGVSLTFSQTNIRIIYKDKKALGQRFLWDSFGIKNWLRQHRVKPITTISLQNTNFRTEKSIPNFIYFHNAVLFSNKTWNPLKKDEQSLLFYKNIYPIFVRLYVNKNTEVFVQSNFIRNSFAEYFNFPIEKIHIISPNPKISALVGRNDAFLDKNQLNLFYPATPYIYKNHSTIIEALDMLDKKFQKQITLHLTCEKSDLSHKIRNTEINFTINFMGKIDFTLVHQLYKEADALLFPSYIETIGLPLLEAASSGLLILVADLPYSHDALKDYNGAVYIPFDDSREWGKEIMNLFTMKNKRYVPLKIEISNSWEKLFRIIQNRVQENIKK